MLTSLKKKDYVENLLYKPSGFDTLMCYSTIPTLGGMVGAIAGKVLTLGGTAIAWVVNLNNPLQNHPNLLLILGAAAGMFGGSYTIYMGGKYKEGFLRHLDFDMCKNYESYNAVNATSPDQFNSLKQFEKYKADHEKAYLALNTSCGIGNQNLSTIKLQPFTYDEKSYSVTLCDLSKNTKSDL